jgi:hypothetical protein
MLKFQNDVIQLINIPNFLKEHNKFKCVSGGQAFINEGAGCESFCPCS